MTPGKRIGGRISSCSAARLPDVNPLDIAYGMFEESHLPSQQQLQARIRDVVVTLTHNKLQDTWTEQCTQFIAPAMCTVLIIQKYLRRFSDMFRYKCAIFRENKIRVLKEKAALQITAFR
jgi:hypothetical protein